MSITETEMKAIREMFMEAADELLRKEHIIIGEMFAPVNLEIKEIKARLKNIEEDLSQQGHVIAEINVEVAKLNLASKISAVKRHG